MERGEKLQKLLLCYVPVVGLLYCMDPLLDPVSYLLYLITGLAGLLVTALLVLGGRMFQRADCRLLLAFTLCFWLSSLCSFGFGLAFFLSRFFTSWCVLLSLYLAAAFIRDRQRLAARFFLACVLGLMILNLSVLILASRSHCEEQPVIDRFYGCFLFGRLWAVGNANILGFYAAALLFASCYGLLNCPGRYRLVFAAGVLLGWMNLGLSGCRTGIVGVSLSAGLLCFLRLHNGAGYKRLLRAALFGMLASAAALLLLYCSVFVYRWIMGLIARLSGNDFLLSNLQTLKLRRLSDDDGTFTGRTLIWARCIREVFRSPRRALLGVSSLGWGNISSVYPGHHEIFTAHAHNELLEILQRFGLIGLGIWLALLGIWCGKGFRLFFDRSRPLFLRDLSALAIGILIMGITEPLPFHPSGTAVLAVPFFLICGCVMQERRHAK